MSKLFWVPFHYADFSQDTDILSNMATGGWIRILCKMWHAQTGTLTGNWQFWSRILRCSVEETRDIIAELKQEMICEITIKEHPKNAVITLINRRLAREEKAKENNKLRQQRHKEKRNSNDKITGKKRKSNSTVVKVKDKDKVKKTAIGAAGKSYAHGYPQAFAKLRFIFSTFRFPLSEKDDQNLLRLERKQLKKKLDGKNMAEQLDAFFCYFKDYESQEDENPRYVGIESKAHLWNLIFKWMDRARPKKNPASREKEKKGAKK